MGCCEGVWAGRACMFPQHGMCCVCVCVATFAELCGVGVACIHRVWMIDAPGSGVCTHVLRKTAREAPTSWKRCTARN